MGFKIETRTKQIKTYCVYTEIFRALLKYIIMIDF